MWDLCEQISLRFLLDSGKQPVHRRHLQGDFLQSERSPDRCPLSLPQHAYLWRGNHWSTEPGRTAPRGNYLSVSLSEPIRKEEEFRPGSGGFGNPEEQPSSWPETRHSPGGGRRLRWSRHWECSALHWTERASSAAPLGGLCYFPPLPLRFAEGGAAAGQHRRPLHP